MARVEAPGILSAAREVFWRGATASRGQGSRAAFRDADARLAAAVRQVEGVLAEFGAAAALYDLTTRLDLIATIDRHASKRAQGVSVGTYLTLAALNRLAELDANHVSDYLASCQDSATGGFLTQRNPQTRLKATRFAIHALAELGQLSRISIAGVRTYIASWQELNPQSPEYGGFYASPGSNSASLVASLDAIQTLSLLGALASVNQTISSVPPPSSVSVLPGST